MGNNYTIVFVGFVEKQIVEQYTDPIQEGSQDSQGGGALLLNVNNNIISTYTLGDSMVKHIKKDGTSVKHLVTV